MDPKHKLRLSLGMSGLVALVALALPRMAATQALPGQPQAVHPQRIIVKYRDSVKACAHCLLKRRVPFASVTGTSALDDLHQRFGIRQAEGLFHEHSNRPRSAAYQRQVQRVGERFPQRTARARAGLTAPDLSNVFVLELGSKAVAEAVAAFAADPDVEYAEPDHQVETTAAPDDPYFHSNGSWGKSFADLWGLHATDAESAWDASTGDGILVAVIDTGIDHRHPELKSKLWTNTGEIPRNGVDDDGNGFVDDVLGWDFVRRNGKVKDGNGHGTHVAGTIAAIGNNATGVLGMAYGSQLMDIRAFDSRGRGWASDMAKAMLYAVNNGADVLNNSWGGAESGTVNQAIATATALGVVVVFAAGNEGSAYLGQAANPQVLAVAATQHDGRLANFSNHGPRLSVAAPGVEILSLRGPNRVGGQRVGRRYRVLSGTSMAAPHVSGVAALLLAKRPELTSDEVRWHIELNADRAPGSDPNEPDIQFGWGTLNAARTFTTPPVRTRLRTSPFELHGLADTTVPGVATLDFGFTTRSPIAWSVGGASWLVPTPAGGTGPARVTLDFDTTGMTPGTYSDTATISAPQADDGGRSLAVTAHVHAEQRSGAPIVVTNTHQPRGGAPRVASDGRGVMIAWVQWVQENGFGRIDLMGAYLDDDGTLSGPFVIDSDPSQTYFTPLKDGSDVAIGSDGTNFLVVWSETLQEFVSETSLRTRRHTRVKAVRVTPLGEVLDTPPRILSHTQELENVRGGFDRFDGGHAVGYDGSGFTVIWRTLDFGSSRRPIEIFLRRVGPEGTLASPLRTVYPTATTERYQAIHPTIACVTASCLMAWIEADGETDANGRYIDKLYGQRFAGDVAIDTTPRRLMTDISYGTTMGSGNGGYFFFGYRTILHTGPPRTIAYDLVGTRISAAGIAADPAGIRLSNVPSGGATSAMWPSSVAFDGSNFQLLWTTAGPPDSKGLTYPFAARVDATGTVLDHEPQGLLLAPGALADSDQPTLTTAETRSYLVWAERPNPPAPARILAQAVLPH